MIVDDPNPALRAELNAALDVLSPELKGMHRRIAAGSSSPDLLAVTNEAIVDRQRRHDAIKHVLDTLDAVVIARAALAADGYPELPPVNVPGSLVAEIDEEGREEAAAAAVFVDNNPADVHFVPEDVTTRPFESESVASSA